jgi:beta-glucosidase
VATPWAEQARAVLQVWFGGQEMADGLVEVLLGDVDPGGRLPTTIPIRLEDNPSWGNFPPEGGRIHYGEGLLVGYRWYESRDLAVSFPFGHGLSYTTFDIGEPQVDSATVESGGSLRVRVPVTNTGERSGSEVVQLYVAPPSTGAFRPVKELKAFAKVALRPGETAVVDLELDERSFARWASPDPELGELISRLSTQVPWTQPPSGTHERGWVIDRGRYELHIGRSSADIAHVRAIDVPTARVLSA